MTSNIKPESIGTRLLHVTNAGQVGKEDPVFQQGKKTVGNEWEEWDIGGDKMNISDKITEKEAKVDGTTGMEEGEETERSEKEMNGAGGSESAETANERKGPEVTREEGGEGVEVQEKEAEEKDEKGGTEAIEEHIEDLMENYRRLGLTESLQHLMTMYPCLNMTDILEDAMSDDKENMGANKGQIINGMAVIGHSTPVMHSLALDVYGDYEINTENNPLLPQAPVHKYKLPSPVSGKIDPTPVLQFVVTEVDSGHEKLIDTISEGPKSPNQEVVRQHSSQMTASAMFGVVVGTVLLSWLLIGPTMCLVWRWHKKRNEKKSILLQRADHASMDGSIAEALVMSELGKYQSGKGVRRQNREDLERALMKDKYEMQTFPSKTTLESQIM